MDFLGDERPQLEYLRHKARVAGGLFVLLLAAVGLRLWDLQVAQGPKLLAAARSETLRTLPLVAPRGKILAAGGQVLATDVPSFAAELSFTARPPSAAETARIARILGVSSKSIRAAEQHLRTGLPFMPVLLKSGLTPKEYTALADARSQLPGVSVVAQAVRVYPGLPGATNPGAKLAANVLGYVKAGATPGQLVGVDGIEQTFQTVRLPSGRTLTGLAGVNGTKLVEINRTYHPIRSSVLKKPIPGNNVVLTLHAGLQAVLQRALTAQLKALRTRPFASEGGPYPNAFAAGAVVIDVHTGAILALGSVPTVDPNAFAQAAGAPANSAAAQAFSARYRRWASEPGRPFVDHAISYVAPPGSTFKPITAIAALEQRAITPWQRLGCPPTLRVGNFTLHNWIPTWDGNLTLRQAMAQSCDTFFYVIGARTGVAAIDRVAAQFGLGQLTGQTDLYGEDAGYVSSPALALRMQNESWTTALTMQTAIGQGLTVVNPLEMADYVAALANGGTLLRPYVVSKVVSPTGRVVWRQGPKVRRRIALPAGVLAAVQHSMNAVTEIHPSWYGNGMTSDFGTGYWPFYQFSQLTQTYLGHAITVAGKTGTAQVGGTKGNDGWWISYAPAHHPQIAVVVFAQHANEGFGSGAPVAREVYDYYFGLDRAMWKAGQASQIVPPIIQKWFGLQRHYPPWWGTPPTPGTSKTAAPSASGPTVGKPTVVASTYARSGSPSGVVGGSAAG